MGLGRTASLGVDPAAMLCDAVAMRSSAHVALSALGVAFAACDAAVTDAPPPAPSVTIAPAEVCADGPTVFGIDVSKWQGTIDWRQVAADGVKYAIIRISDGPNVLDGKFVANWAGALEHGIPRGSYQFFRQDEDPVVQADIVIDYHQRYGLGELPPVIDVESTDGADSATMVRNIRAWLDRVEAALGVQPIIYTGRYFWNGNVDSTAFSDYPLWHAQYTGAACPNIAAAWSRWTLWQYSSTGTVAGISGGVDMNRFNGTEAELLAMVGEPRCRETPDVAVCDGEGIGTCDDRGRYGVTPCPTGSRCTDGPLCVDVRCEAGGGPDASFCLDDATRADCAGGVLTAGTCAAGARCFDPPGEPAPGCVPARCLGETGLVDGAWCVDSETREVCAGGALTQTPCPSGSRCEAGLCGEVTEPQEPPTPSSGAPLATARHELRGSIRVVEVSGCNGGTSPMTWLAWLGALVVGGTRRWRAKAR